MNGQDFEPQPLPLYQPTFLGVRSDVGLIECTTDQLKFKPAEDEGEE
jgi:hypothetical protein